MFDSLRRVLALAKITMIDGIKRNAFIGMLLFALAGQLSGVFFFEFIPRDIGRMANDLTFSVSFLAGLLYILFHAVQVMASGSQNRTIHTFLARPISRTEYLLGNFIGLALLLLFLNLLMAGVGWFVLLDIKGNVFSAYFSYLSFTHYALSFLALYLIELTLLAVVVFFASVVRGSFPVVLLTLAYYFICTGQPVVRESVMQKFTDKPDGFLPVFFKVLSGIFPDFSRLDFKSMVIDKDDMFIASKHLPILGTFSLYVVVLLWFASIFFRKKDIL